MNKLKIGWASRDISTNEPINIPGQFHMRISQGILDPLTLTALVIDNDSDLVIFLSADLVVVRSFLLDEVRAKVSQLDPSIPVEKILMNATHTHAGASHYLDNKDIPRDGVEVASSDEYRAFLAGQAAAAVVEAYQKRSFGGVAYGYGYAVVGHNRRVIYFDDTSKRPGEKASGYRVNGHGVMYGDTSDDNFSHFEGGADHFVNLLFTFDEEDKLTGAIINVPAPSQNTEGIYQLSADYWHDVRQLIRQEFGDIFILPQCAAAGDLAPRILHYKKAQARRFQLKYGMSEAETELAARKDIAERISAAFSEVYAWAKKDIKTELELKHEVVTAQLTKRRITDEELAFAKEQLAELEKQELQETGGTALERLNYNSQLVSQKGRFSRIIDRYEVQDKEPKMPMEMHVLRIGDVAFASNRFELFMDYMHRIQARSPFLQTFVIQLTGVPGADGGTYLATERAVANKGYSACLFCNQVSPQGGQDLVEQTLEILNELHQA